MDRFWDETDDILSTFVFSQQDAPKVPLLYNLSIVTLMLRIPKNSHINSDLATLDLRTLGFPRMPVYSLPPSPQPRLSQSPVRPSAGILPKGGQTGKASISSAGIWMDAQLTSFLGHHYPTSWKIQPCDGERES